jgi:hypothetical protein
MAETPSWLADEAVVTAVVNNPTAQKAATAAAKVVVEEEAKKHGFSPTKDVESGNGGEGNNDGGIDPGSAEALGISPEELKKIQMWGLILRVSYMCASILMAAAAALAIQNGGLSIVFIALYVFFFAIIICCFEVALNVVALWIAQNFGFMYTLLGRILFIVFVASLCYNLKLFGKIVMGILLALVVLNIGIIIVFPKYETWLRAKHFTSGKK